MTVRVGIIMGSQSDWATMREAAAILDEFEKAGARDAMMSTDAAEAEALFDARRLAYPNERRIVATAREILVHTPPGHIDSALARRATSLANRHDP